MIQIVEYRASWVEEFVDVAVKLRTTLGDAALAIHHIGSTSVPGLVAKDVIDIQVTVAELSIEIAQMMIDAGYLACRGMVDHCPPGMSLPDEQLMKFLFNGPGRKANIHLRVEERFNQRYSLLWRDYLRTHRSAADAYGRVKQELARYFPENADAYYDIKDPVFDVLMAGAREWAVHVEWQPPYTDA